MKACHVSDTHGLLYPLMDADIVIHSGDFMPSFTRGIAVCEVQRQEIWMMQNMSRIKGWIGDRPFLFVPGNHDYFDPIPSMVAAGIDAKDIQGNHWIYGKHFYGYPWVKYFTGEWNRELSEKGISETFDSNGAGVVVAHCPIYGVLDRNGGGAWSERCGSRAIRTYLQDCSLPPTWYLHGHIHEANGTQGWSRGIKVSNAATTRRVIEI